MVGMPLESMRYDMLNRYDVLRFVVLAMGIINIYVNIGGNAWTSTVPTNVVSLLP